MNVAKVVFILGGRADLARVCGESRQLVNNWLVVPEKHRDRVRKEIKGRVAKINKIAGEL